MIRFSLRKLLYKKGVSQLELHRKTGIRLATINAMVNNKHEVLNLKHLYNIMTVLNVYEIDEYLEVIGGNVYADYEIGV